MKTTVTNNSHIHHTKRKSFLNASGKSTGSISVFWGAGILLCHSLAAQQVGLNTDIVVESALNPVAIDLKSDAAFGAGLNLETGAFELKFSGESGSSHFVQVSSDLSNWEWLTTVEVDGESNTAIDSNAEAEVNGFYRVALSVFSPIKDTSVSSGDTTSFELQAEGLGELEYTWMLNGELITDNEAHFEGASTSMLIISDAQAEHGGLVEVIVQSSSGAMLQSSAMLEIVAEGELPLIISSPSDASAETGNDVVLTVQAESDSQLTFQWRKDGQLIGNDAKFSGATSTQLTIHQVASSDQGEYDVVVTNEAGVTVSHSAQLMVEMNSEAQLPVIVEQPQQTETKAGSEVMLTVQAESETNLTYQWRKDGEAISDSLNFSGTTSAQLTIHQATESDQGIYDVIITNETGSTTSTAAELTVDADINVLLPVILSQPESVESEAGSDVTLSVEAVSETHATYQWRKDGQNIENNAKFSGATSAQLTILQVGESEQGIYDVIITNEAGATTSSSAQVTLEIDIEALLPSITEQPEGISVEAGATAEFQIIAESDSQLTYQWRINGMILVDGPNISGSTSSKLTLHSTTEVMEGEVDVIVSNEHGSISSVKAMLEVRAVALPPEIVEQPSNTSVTLGASARFSISVQNSAAANYQWFHNGIALTNSVDISGATSAELTVSNVSVEDLGAYVCRVENESGFVISEEAVLSASVL